MRHRHARGMFDILVECAKIKNSRNNEPWLRKISIAWTRCFYLLLRPNLLLTLIMVYVQKIMATCCFLSDDKSLGIDNRCVILLLLRIVGSTTTCNIRPTCIFCLILTLMGTWWQYIILWRSWKLKERNCKIIFINIKMKSNLFFCIIWLTLYNLTYSFRRAYHIMSYFMFYFNIFLGLTSCLMRVLYGLLFGVIFLQRLPKSTLSRPFESMDPGKSHLHAFPTTWFPLPMLYVSTSTV